MGRTLQVAHEIATQRGQVKLVESTEALRGEKAREVVGIFVNQHDMDWSGLKVQGYGKGIAGGGGYGRTVLGASASDSSRKALRGFA